MNSLVLVAFALFGAVCVHADVGTMTNCGDAAHNFQGTWDPNPVVLHQNLTVSIVFVPVVNASTLNADISVKFAGIPIYNGNRVIPCSSKLPVCPIVAGKSTNETLVIPFNFPVPQGHYTIQVNITNDSGAALICGVIDTHVVSSAFERVKPAVPLTMLPTHQIKRLSQLIKNQLE